MTDDGYHYCYDCEYDNAFWCDYHECYERYPDEARTVITYNGHEETWCDSAVCNHAFWCDYSEEWYDDRHYHDVRVYNSFGDWEIWERSQAQEHAYYCGTCENYFEEGAYNFSFNCCDECFNDIHNCELLNRYHYSKDNGTLHFYGESKYVNPVGLGFELEVDTSYENAQKNQNKLIRAINERFGDRLTFEHDGSLDCGFEIISAPHTKSEMALVDWSELLNLCKEHGYTSHDAGTCGLHFHISGYMFGATKEKQHDTIAKVLAFYEYYYEEFYKLSRRTRSQVDDWAQSYDIFYDGNMELYKKNCLQTVENFANYSCHDDRYYAINLTNNDRSTNLFKTVEFRINRGTLNINTFNATYDMLLQIIKNAKRIDWNDSDFFNPKKWLSGCKANTYAYIVKRNAFEGVFYLANANSETEYTQENV